MRKSCFESMFALSFGIMLMSASVFITGCPSTSKIPEPATNDGLSSAESTLDHLTDKRISRVAASVVVAEQAVNKIEPNNTPEVSIAKGELQIARAMTGEPTKSDLEYATKRAEVLANGLSRDDVKKVLAENIARSEALRNEINSANQRYEQEKAKKQAEYEAKLKEKDAEIANRKMELEQERIAKREERFTWAGIGLMTLGILVIFAVPSTVAKKLGIGLTLAGVSIGVIPFIGNEPWFKWVVIGVVASAVIAGLVKFFLFKPKCEVDTPSKDISSDSEQKSDDNPN